METVAFLGLLGLGYIASSKFAKKSEGFADAPANQLTPIGAATIPGKPRQPSYAAAGGYDLQFQLPAGGSLPSEPNPSKKQGGPLHFPVPPVSLPTQSSQSGPGVQLRMNRTEADTPRAGFVSQLTGIEFKSGEFKHANMVPFAKKFTQNTGDAANSPLFDSYTGNGAYSFAKREQGQFFEPTKEPTGNPNGFESSTDFMESRMVESRNRAGERPVEQIRVGPGLNQGFTHLPSGGFQQQDGEDFMIARMPRVDDMRVATNPKLTYNTPAITGSHYVGTANDAEQIGEVRKYTADTFFLNENGERNFVTTGADVKAASRAVQVLKHTARPETSKEYTGVGAQTEGKATYTVGSTRTPLAKQMGTWGYRNANLTSEFNKNTDSPENDYGKSGVEILPNERYYTGTRVHATNVAPDRREVGSQLQDAARTTIAEETIRNPRSAGNFNALGAGLAEKATSYDPNDVARTTVKETTIDNDWLGMAAPTDSQPRLTVYDPNDVARTTIKETTIDNEYIGGVAAAADAAQKLTVYDPDDVARTTGRNTLADWDVYRNFGRQDLPDASTSRIQDTVRLTQKAAISAKSAYSGGAESSSKMEANRGSSQAMRHYAQRENVAKGRVPTNSGVKLYNGEDNMNVQYRSIVSDSVNDREPAQDRVGGAIVTGAEVIGSQRPRAALKLDISAIRNEPVVVSSLESNPYVLPLNRIARAQQQ